MGFQVEFRPMDTPMDEIMKVALVSFLVIFWRMISDKDYGFYMYVPISKMNINFERAV